MIKSKYILSQEQCCGVPGNFIVHQMADDDNKNEQQSGFSQLNFAPQNNIGKFQQSGTHSCCCFSCKSIKELSLVMYGQRLSQATTQTSCCFNICGGQLTVSTMNKVIIGKIKKTCSSWFSPHVLLIENQQGKDIFFINMKCCQAANVLPRIFRCNQHLQYQIVNSEGKLVGKITNTSKNCSTSLFSLRDDFNIHFIDVQKQKQKILLLNAVVFLNQIRHQWI